MLLKTEYDEHPHFRKTRSPMANARLDNLITSNTVSNKPSEQDPLVDKGSLPGASSGSDSTLTAPLVIDPKKIEGIYGVYYDTKSYKHTKHKIQYSSVHPNRFPPSCITNV